MDLKEILEFIKKNKELLSELQKSTADVISDAKSLVIENNKKQAQDFAKALDGEAIKVEGGEDRLRALNAAILELERELLETEDTLREMAINHQLAGLLQKRANVAIASGFDKVVAFQPEEKGEIVRLLKKVEDDIQARKDLKTAIDITVRLIAIAAKIAGKAATFGIA